MAETLPILVPHELAVHEDAPSPWERLLSHRGVQYGGGLAAIALLAVLGAGPELVLALGTLAIGAPRLLLAMAFSRHFRRGLYRRSLFVTTHLLEQSWWWRDEFIWQLNQATCYMALGDLERGKALACRLRNRGLPAYADWAIHVNLAALYLKLGEAESALAVLSPVGIEQVPEYGQVHYLLNRAGAHALAQNWPAALSDLERADFLTPPPELRAGCLSLRAYILVEHRGDHARALALSNEAVHLLGTHYRVQAGVLVAHARIVLDATGNVVACLEILALAVEHEAELGLPDQAEMHYLFARCCDVSGMPVEAHAHLQKALDLPTRSPLAERIREFSGTLHGRARSIASDQGGSRCACSPLPCS